MQGERRVDAHAVAPGLARSEGAVAPGAPAGGQDAWREAVRLELWRTVERHKVYPDRARRMNWEGRVALSFHVFEDGTIRDIKVARSSGFSVLDDAARDLLKQLRLSRRPAEKMRLELAVEYRLE
jgi:protein TonB